MEEIRHRALANHKTVRFSNLHNFKFKQWFKGLKWDHFLKIIEVVYPKLVQQVYTEYPLFMLMACLRL